MRKLEIAANPSGGGAGQTAGDILTVNEIFYSIQGESSYAGLPCVFVRLTECNLRCSYCDTEYAFYEGIAMPLDRVLEEVDKYRCGLVEITGGEPLLQASVHTLMSQLIERGKKVLLETGGSLDISPVPSDVTIILDIKTPGSKMDHQNLWSNLDLLKPADEIKFVVCDREDYEWARQVILDRRLGERFRVLISPVFGSNLANLAGWILEDHLQARFQIQLHKIIWGADARGV